MWLIDTGCPVNMSVDGSGRAKVVLAAFSFEVYQPQQLRQLGQVFDERTLAASLSALADVPVVGVLGMAVWGRFDVTFDIATQAVTLFVPEGAPVSQARDTHIPLTISPLGGVPLIRVSVSQSEYALVFDTGAPLCYLEDKDIDLMSFPSAGPYEDFHPTLSQSFTVDTHHVPISFGGFEIIVRSSRLPPIAAKISHDMAIIQSQGAVGQAVLIGRRVTMSVRRGALILHDTSEAEVVD